MNAFRQYWSFSAIRGAMTILACVAILGIPYFAAAILPIPVTVGFAIDCLAVYCLLDAGALFLLGISIPKRASGRKALFAHTAAALFFGAVLLVLTHGEFAQYLMWVVAGQAGVAAVAQFFVADETHEQYGCLSCYAGAMVLALCALGLPFASTLDTGGQLSVLAGYVGLYGATQLTLAARMLFVEYRAEHPAAVADEAWRLEMNQAALVDVIADPPLVAQRPYLMPAHGGRMVPSRQHAA